MPGQLTLGIWFDNFVNDVPPATKVQIGWFQSNVQILSGGIFAKFLDENYGRSSAVLNYKPVAESSDTVIHVDLYKEELHDIKGVYVVRKLKHAANLIKEACSYSEDKYYPTANSYHFIEAFRSILAIKIKDIPKYALKYDIVQLATIRHHYDEYFYQIERMVEAGDAISIGWYQKTSTLKHTGFVLRFDGEEKFTLDFGTENNESIAQKVGSSGKLGGVHISEFEKLSDRYIYHGVLCELTSDQLINFLNFCYYDIKSYRLVSNNCRDFLIHGAKYLLDNRILDISGQNAFLETIYDIKSRDISPITAVGALTVVGVAATFFQSWSILVTGVVCTIAYITFRTCRSKI